MKKLILTLLLITNAGIAKADLVAIHGMVLFGKKSTYASHMPMFHAPHDYQLLLKIRLIDTANVKTVGLYQQLNMTGNELFTLLPEKMDLAKIISGNLKQFQASLYQGNFEDGGRNLGPLIVSIEKVVLTSKLNPADSEQNQYFIFGENEEYFAIHKIYGEPSYDSIVSITPPYKLEFPVCQTRVCNEKITHISDDQIPLSLPFNGHAAEGDQLGTLNKIWADILQVIYHSPL